MVLVHWKADTWTQDRIRGERYQLETLDFKLDAVIGMAFSPLLSRRELGCFCLHSEELVYVDTVTLLVVL